MKLTRKQLVQIIKEEVSKIFSEGMEVPQGEAMLDMIYDSRPGDLIYYGVSALRRMQAEIENEIIEAEKEYHKFHDGDTSWAEDNIVPLQQMHDKITQAMKDAIDMGFGEV